jgi:hypothetical protein
VLAAEPAVCGWEHEVLIGRTVRCEPPRDQVLAYWPEQVDGSRRSTDLLALAATVRDRLLDKQRATPHVPPLERKRFLRSKARICEYRDEGRISQAPAVKQLMAKALDELWRERVDGVLAPCAWLSDGLCRGLHLDCARRARAVNPSLRFGVRPCGP